MKPQLSREQKHRQKQFRARAVKLAKHLLPSDRELHGLARSNANCAKQIAAAFSRRNMLLPATRKFFEGFEGEGPLPHSVRQRGIADFIASLDDPGKMIAALDAFVPAIITTGSDAIVVELMEKMQHRQVKLAMGHLKRAPEETGAGVFAAILDLARTEVDLRSFGRVLKETNRKVVVPMSQQPVFPHDAEMKVREKMHDLRISEIERLQRHAERQAFLVRKVS